MMGGPNIGLVLDPDLRQLDPGAQDLLSYWESNRSPGGLPDRSAFDPLVLRRFLGNLLIADVETAPSGDRRFRYRLIGTDLAEISGRDVTGRYFDDIYDPVALAEMQHCFGWVLENRQPARVFGTLRHANRAFLGFEGIFLPISTDGSDTASQVIGYVSVNAHQNRKQPE